MKIVASILIAALAQFAVALPPPTKSDDAPTDLGYAGRASQIIATNLLKENIDIDANDVYSPLGIASVLAILAEGAQDETYNEFVAALGYPSSKSILRESFHKVLASFNADYDNLNGINPSFLTWMYIYRNNSVKDDYKRILRDSYFVDVKDINRNEYDWSEPDTSPSKDATMQDNGKDVIGFETLKKSRPFTDDDVDEDGLYHLEEIRSALAEQGPQKESSKFDKFVDDKQYVETPLIKKEVTALPEVSIQSGSGSDAEEEEEAVVGEEELINDDDAKSAEQSAGKQDGDENVEDNETIGMEEKLDGLRKNFGSSALAGRLVSESNEPEKITIPLHKLGDGGEEVAHALTSHFSSKRLHGARTLFKKDDIASALSANSITGREYNSKTKLLLFNGMYYRGNWAFPFQELRSGPKDHFYVTKEKTIAIQMMRSRGKFRSAECDSLNARAVEFPYENKRYSLVVIYPNDRDGLRSLIEKIEPSHLNALKDYLKESSMFISLPKFQIEETTRSESMLIRLGLRRLFSRDFANLSVMSDDTNLHVDEVVQYVNIRVDEGASSENSLVGTSARTGDPDEKVVIIDRPFVYFVLDREENFVLVSGKVTAPEYKGEDDFDLDVEYSLS